MLATRKHLLLAVQQRPIIQEITRLEPEIEAILRIAASYENVRARWYAYEALKKVSTLFVGYDAANPALAPSRYYEAMIDAIDTLLPGEPDETEDDWAS